jgi:hypothetical protein
MSDQKKSAWQRIQDGARGADRKPLEFNWLTGYNSVQNKKNAGGWTLESILLVEIIVLACILSITVGGFFGFWVGLVVFLFTFGILTWLMSIPKAKPFFTIVLPSMWGIICFTSAYDDGGFIFSIILALLLFGLTWLIHKFILDNSHL